MKKNLISVFLLIAGLTVWAQAQNRAACRLTFEELPAIRGLRLGMTAEEAAALYPQLRLSPSENSFSGIALEGRLSKDAVESEEYKTNLEFFHFVFFDRHLAAVTIRYDNLIAWNDTAEFTRRVTDFLGVSFASWRPARAKKGFSAGYNLACRDFSIRTTLFQSKYPTLMLMRRTEDVLAANEERKKTFKP